MQKKINSLIHLISNEINPLAADLILPSLISAITYFPLIYLFPEKIEDLISGKWIYIHPGDADENIRTAFLSTWGYTPIKDIAINHTPGVPGRNGALLRSRPRLCRSPRVSNAPVGASSPAQRRCQCPLSCASPSSNPGGRPSGRQHGLAP